MQIDKLSEDRIIGRHSKPELRRWINTLRYFYFIRAWGGHANDGDTFKAAIRYASQEDLQNKLRLLGLEPADAERHGHSEIAGMKCFLHLRQDSIELHVSGTKDGNYYEVSEADFELCLALEKLFDSLGWQAEKHTGSESSILCISRTRYPELFD